jgi:hypothetical protein
VEPLGTRECVEGDGARSKGGGETRTWAASTDPAIALPIQPALQQTKASLLGQPLQLAGYGVTETDAFGTRQFLTEMLVRLEDEWLVVDGGGRTGACAGDSGGPLLYRCGNGAPCALGVLSVGSSSCTGEDFFQRLDLVESWLMDHTGVPLPAQDAPCGGVTPKGSCFGDLAVHCSADQKLQAQRCDEDRPCRWSDSASAFGCYGTPSDQCGDLTQIGRCDGARAQRCEGGTFEVVDCASEGLECRNDPSSGVATCL